MCRLQRNLSTIDLVFDVASVIETVSRPVLITRPGERAPSGASGQRHWQGWGGRMGPVRVSHFWQLMEDEFGGGYGRLLADRQVLAGVGDRTATQALQAGVDPRAVWIAICDAMEVPAERRLGVDHRPRRPSAD